MNNPDEETAVAQFGKDDKYFGVCTLMCTMPGLPMFGHGQVEGFAREVRHGVPARQVGRAGRTAAWSSGTSGRSSRILKKRYLFSGVERLRALRLRRPRAAASTRTSTRTRTASASERALVLFNNKFKDTRGRIFHAIPTRAARTARDRHRPSAEALGIDAGARRLDGLPRCDQGARVPAADERDRRRLLLGARRVQVPRVPRVPRRAARRRRCRTTSSPPMLAGRGVPSIERAMLAAAFPSRARAAAPGAGQGTPRVSSPPGGTRRRARPRRRCSPRSTSASVTWPTASRTCCAGRTAEADPEVVEKVLATLRERFTSILTRAHAKAEVDKRAIHVTNAKPAPAREAHATTWTAAQTARRHGRRAAGRARGARGLAERHRCSWRGRRSRR